MNQVANERICEWFPGHSQIRKFVNSHILLLLATAAAGPLLLNAGFLNTRGGGDSPFLLFRLHQLATALADGHFPVRWMPDAAYGLGYPFFSYYAALPFYVGAALHFWGFGLITAIKLTHWLGFLLAAWAMWGLVHHLSRNRWAAWLAAVAYTFAPYHLVNVYVRGDSLTEFWAMGFFPLILWMAARLWERPERRRLILFALSYAALICTHNISALIFSPFLLLFLFLLGSRPVLEAKRPENIFTENSPPARVRLRGGIWGLAGVLLGLALSAFFWLPALGEQDAVQLAAQTSGYFHYSNHFRTLGSDAPHLIQSALFFDYDVAGRTPFSMGLVQAVLTAVGIITALLRLCRRRPPNLPTLFPLLTLAISTLMITPAFRFLWDNLPLLPLVQFPWRFLSIQALATAFLIAQIPNLKSQISNPLIPALLTFLIPLGSLIGLRPDFVSLSSADVTAEQLQLYEWFSGNVGTTIRYEYLPRDVRPRLYTSEGVISGRPMEMEAKTLAGEAAAVQLSKRTGRESWQVDVRSNAATIAFPTLYWPGWRARVDGEPTPLRPAESLGTMTLDLPAGQHTVTLTLGRTPLRLVAELFSLTTLLICALWWVRDARITHHASRITLYVITTGLLLHLFPHTPPPTNDLTWDFDQQTYLHHNPAGVPFGEAAVMQSYQIGGPDAISPYITVTIQWDQINRPNLEAELALVHPAEVVQQVPYTLAVERQLLAAERSETIFTLALPDTAPPGPLLPRLRLFDPDGNPIPALTSAGNPRGDLYLRPLWPPPPAPAVAEGNGVQLSNVQAQTWEPKVLAVTLQWRVGSALPANYNLALRLHDPAGHQWAALDTQPGYGFYPTGAWQAGTTFHDRLALNVPYGLPPGNYTLSVSLYNIATLTPHWGPQKRSITITTAAPYNGRPLLHRFSRSLAAASLTAPDAISQGDPLSFTVGWVTLNPLHTPPAGRWELLNDDGDVVAGKAIELEQWPAGSLVLGRYTAATDPQIPPGNYTLQLIMLDGQPWDASAVTIQERPRRFELPEMETRLGTEFGRLARLEGYNLNQGNDVLTLTLYWRALDALPADYLVFVHLFDPATEQIVAQHDAMPRDNSYPTSRWAPGEVVDDPTTLTLAGVPTGRYRLGVGLYRLEGEHYTRLPAVDALGEALPDGRVVLPAEITIPTHTP